MPVLRRAVKPMTVAVAATSLLGFAVSSAAQPVSATASPPCRHGAITRSPSPGPYIGLSGVSALSSQDVWSAGYYIKTDQSLWRPLIEHWDGQRWAVVPAARSVPYGIFYAMAAVSSSDVWAVGLRVPPSGGLHRTPLIEHWNGSTWTVVPSPSLTGLLDGVAVASPDDIWAVGFRRTFGGTRPDKTLIEHWDGTRWQLVPSPDPTRYGDDLAAVTVAGPDDVWAAGTEGISKTNIDTDPLAEHWDGHTWSAVTMPALGFNNGMRGIAADGGTDVWAVGWYDVESPTGTLTFTMSEHWNGHRWSTVPTFSPTGDDLLDGVVVLSARDVWAVGASGYNLTFVLHWNGRGWTSLPSPSLNHAVNVLWAVSAPTATDIWAAGGGYQTLIMHICPPAGG